MAVLYASAFVLTPNLGLPPDWTDSTRASLRYKLHALSNRDEFDWQRKTSSRPPSAPPLSDMDSPKQTAAFLIALLNTKGQGDYIGEPISQLEHSLQAAHLAKADNADEETVIAALLHDIGQFLPAEEVQSIAYEVRSMTSETDASAGGVGRVGHERIGEEYLLRLGFSRKVASLVGSHVAAKRYLCATDPSYHETLSDASKKSLIFQGGPMNGRELEEWAANPWCVEMCQLRKWDDGAKVVGLEVDPADAYGATIERVLSQSR